jgi:hypothetical protein
MFASSVNAVSAPSWLQSLSYQFPLTSVPLTGEPLSSTKRMMTSGDEKSRGVERMPPKNSKQPIETSEPAAKNNTATLTFVPIKSSTGPATHRSAIGLNLGLGGLHTQYLLWRLQFSKTRFSPSETPRQPVPISFFSLQRRLLWFVFWLEHQFIRLQADSRLAPRYVRDMSFKEVLACLPDLTLSERQTLIRRALELDDPGLSPEDEALVAKLLADHRRDPASAVSATEMKRRLRRRVGR